MAITVDDIMSEIDKKPEPEQNEKREYKPREKKDYDAWMNEIQPVVIDKSSFIPSTRAYAIEIGKDPMPEDVKNNIIEVIKILNEKGFMLRSSADYRNHPECKDLEKVAAEVEYHVPWDGFLGDMNNEVKAEGNLVVPKKEHFGMAMKLHGAFSKIPNVVKKFVTTKITKVFGRNIKKPIAFLILYSTDGAETSKNVKYEKIGNANFAMKCAEYADVPIFNFYKEDAKSRLMEYINSRFG